MPNHTPDDVLPGRSQSRRPAKPVHAEIPSGSRPLITLTHPFGDGPIYGVAGHENITSVFVDDPEPARVPAPQMTPRKSGAFSSEVIRGDV